MAGLNGRRAPNFAQYLDDLNAIPSPYDQAVQQQQQQQNTFNLDEELALFTNAEFFDFDKFADLGLPTFDSVEEKTAHGESLADHSTRNADMKFLEFLNDGLGNMEYQPNLHGVHVPSMPIQNASFAVPSVPNGSVAANPAPVQNSPTTTPQSVAAPPTPTTPAAAAGPKRKHTQKSTQASAEEAARVIAEEDKRRRNTAASARFRVKKKQREQALERTVKETTEKNDALEARVSQLELENHWLRGLIMEKNGTEERDEQSEKAISDMFKSYLASREPESSLSKSKHGVGTSV
ncbi:Regulatory protein cys-3 [Penicillium macrosclerotiorum]|uniref:Regulatory protein cys-3 n=1 Tax=Penicillium macrosclerotiorum TaxID=303699 RepID=UPI00254698E5|nr:Regulatory protein cys-3 [Penicillium macrosclerotiorum]KAJ5673997.1 Regulatory protein cys-3 [Penicillium macrosclerotiorum]